MLENYQNGEVMEAGSGMVVQEQVSRKYCWQYRGRMPERLPNP